MGPEGAVSAKPEEYKDTSLVGNYKNKSTSQLKLGLRLKPRVELQARKLMPPPADAVYSFTETCRVSQKYTKY